MANIESLPNEVLCKVLENVQPGDLENFAKISPNVSTVAAPFLQDHRRYIELYRAYSSISPTLALNSPAHPSLAYPSLTQPSLTQPPLTRPSLLTTPQEPMIRPISSLFEALFNKIQSGHYRPHIGHYIREIRLDPCVVPRSREYRRQIRLSARFKRLYEQRGLLALAALRVSDDECFRLLSDLAEISPRVKRFEDSIVSFLLPLFPNLNSLTILGIENVALLPSLTRALEMSPVANVTAITLGHSEPQVHHSAWPTLHCLRELKSLKSLKSLKVTHINDGVETRVGEAPPSDSHVTELALIETYISPPNLYFYLRSFPKLRKFSFQRLRERDNINEKSMKGPDRVGWIQDVLKHRNRSTLQELVVLGEFWPLDTLYHIPIGSIREFQILQVFRTEWEYLFPDGCRPNTWPSEILPASLCKLFLIKRSEHELEQYKTFFEGLHHVKSNTCPQLITVDLKLWFHSEHPYPIFENKKTFWGVLYNGLLQSFDAASVRTERRADGVFRIDCVGTDQAHTEAVRNAL